MLLGVPKEVKDHEGRVGLVPASIAELVAHGHSVIVESGAGDGSGILDEEFRDAGAQMEPRADAIWARADLIVKVKEPQKTERLKLRPGQILFTYLHLAPDPEQAADLIKSGAVCIAYETVTGPAGGLPLLTPMSEVAGRMAVQVGAKCLENAQGGRGILLGGVPGVAPANVLILGGGVSGTNALLMALGAGAQVTVLDNSVDVLRRLVQQFGTSIRTIYSTRKAVTDLIASADLVIGAVLIPGANAPKLITKPMLRTMKPGSAIVDIAIDQGGCAETSKPTTHSNPTYIVDGVVHYCVANMPGGVARTSTFALNNVTLPFTLALANKGWRQALTQDAHLRKGLNIANGAITYKAVAQALGQKAVEPEAILAA
jgi:alanine dehydrogenase